MRNGFGLSSGVERITAAAAAMPARERARARLVLRLPDPAAAVGLKQGFAR